MVTANNIIMVDDLTIKSIKVIITIYIAVVKKLVKFFRDLSFKYNYLKP